MSGDRRQFSRLIYPDDCRPKLLISPKKVGDEEFEVKNISETGVCFIGQEDSRFIPNSKLVARITFSDGESLDVEGVILRVGGKETAAYLLKGVPSSRIGKERELLGD